jgi:hypothetical protein
LSPARQLARVLALASALLLTVAAGARAAELVMFDDPDCVWCRRWLAEIGPGYPRTPEGRQAPLRRVLIRKQADAGVALARPVSVTPTFVLVEDEQEVGRIAGYPGSDFFYPMLDELLRKLPPPKPARRPLERSTMCAQSVCQPLAPPARLRAGQ